MKLGIMQPYFLPYIGYWQLIKAVDKYVIYDDVNYIKKGWINRNNIVVNREKNMFTISLSDPSQLKHINEIEIADDFAKFIKTVKYNYSKAPYYNDVMPILESIVEYKDTNLSNFITNSIREINAYLSIDTEIIMSSQLNKDNDLKGKDKIMDICKILKADTYINAIGGQELYDKKEFVGNNIELMFLQPEITPYKQGSHEFIPGLSILDVLMHNSAEQVNEMLDKYTLI